MDLAEKLAKKQQNLYIFGHHHIYDLYGYLPKDIWTNPDFKLIIPTPTLAKYKDNIWFCDTLSFFRGSLDKMGKELGFPKGKMPEKVKVLSELKDYCMQDCRVTLKFMTNLKAGLKELGYCPRNILTAGNVAKSTFFSHIRKNGLHYDLMYSGEVFKSPHIAKTRFALRGGRCQAFQKGIFENAKLYDINSEYTKVMADLLDNEMPNLKDYLYLQNPTLKDWEMIKTLTGTIECTMDINTKEVPFLPVKYKKYQVTPSKARVRGRWTIPEIVYALSLDGYKLRSIHWAEVYKKSKINPFKIYMLDLFNKGIEEPEFKPVSKLLRNNLFGKFSQFKWQFDTKYVPRQDVDKFEADGYEFEGLLNELVIMKKKTGEYIASYTNPLISSLITALGRIYLHKLLIKIPKKDLLYCDTDSILFVGDHEDKLPIHPTKLGFLKIEKQGTATIYGEKDYRIDDKIAIAGLPGRNCTEENWNKDQIEINRQIGFAQAVKRNDLNLMGGFEKSTFQRTHKSKLNLKLPGYIDEREHYEEK